MRGVQPWWRFVLLRFYTVSEGSIRGRWLLAPSVTKMVFRSPWSCAFLSLTAGGLPLDHGHVAAKAKGSKSGERGTSKFAMISSTYSNLNGFNNGIRQSKIYAGILDTTLNIGMVCSTQSKGIPDIFKAMRLNCNAFCFYKELLGISERMGF